MLVQQKGRDFTPPVYGVKGRFLVNEHMSVVHIFNTEQLEFFSHSVQSVSSFLHFVEQFFHHHTWNTQILLEMLQIKKMLK